MRTRTRIASLSVVAVLAATAVPAAAIATDSDKKRKNDSQRSSHSNPRTNAVVLGGDGTKIARIDTSAPWKSWKSVAVSGLAGDDRLVGIDYRVQNGKLYGVGDEGGVYTVNAKSGATAKVSQLSVALSGSTFGVDFNPAANRLRVVSADGQNLRHNIDDGATAGTTIVDGSLTYPPATTTASGITAAAYTNNDLSATTATTLFDIDTALDQVVVQSPANAGALAPTGKLGVDAGSDAGLDIYSDLDRNGVTQKVTAFAVLQVAGKSGLYKVDLLTGDADRVGTFTKNVSDIAIQLDR